MDATKIKQKIDPGRIVAVPLFTLIMVVNIVNIRNPIRTLQPVNMIKAAGLVHHLLLICFYALIIFLYFLRSSARSTLKSWASKVIAVMATFSPFSISILNNNISYNPAIVIVANLIMIFGIFFSIWALFVLGKNFSIIPQARNLVQSGPYRMVRHPLYLGEMVSVLGVVLARFTASTVAVLFLLISCQVYRAIQEENLLGGIFPEYKSYCLRTARFIPGVF